MDHQKVTNIINTISKGDLSFAESLFSKPGGRKYFENLVLIVLSNTPMDQDEKEELFFAFSKGLNKIVRRIKRQKDGQTILKEVFEP